MIGEGLDVSIAIHPRAVKCRGKVVHLLQVLDERAVGGVRVEAGVSFEEMSEDNEVYLRGYLTDLLEQKASGRSRKRTSV
jgi:hypothetical protein